MYLPCIIVYFGCIRGLDDVLTSNTSKYIQYIRPAKSGCIGKIWMYCVCIEDVSDVSDVLKIVFGMYCVSISNVLEFRINCLFMVIALMIAGRRHFDRISSLEDVLESSMPTNTT